MSEKRDNLINDFPNEWNIIPISRNSKVASSSWKNYQDKEYPRNKLLKNNGNYAVICGEISNNLLILDLDLRDKKHFNSIYSKFQNKYPELSKTLIVETPHGYHLYYCMNGFSETSHNRKNACYNEKLKFTGSVKTQFKEYLKGFDCKGNGGYAIIPPSRVDNLYYKYHNEEDIKHITLDDYTKINSFFLLDKPKNLRKPFKDILNGKIEIEEQANKTGKEEFLYWKYLFREVYNYCGLEPKELYKGLEKNQPNFDVVKTETQLNHHDFHEKPLTNIKIKELFPDHYAAKEKSKSYISTKRSKSKKEEDKEESKEIPNAYEIAKDIMSKINIFTPKEYMKALLIYRKGSYQEEASGFLNRIILRYFEITGYYKGLTDSEFNTKVGTIRNWIKAQTYCSIKDFDNYDNLKNVENGILDISDLDNIQLLKHNPKYRMRIQLPLIYDPNAKCKKISDIIRKVLGKENELLYHEYLGDTINGMPEKFQKCLVLFGEGFTGKSTILNINHRFLGKEYTKEIPLQDLNDDKHALAELENVLANIYGDLPSKYLKNVDKIKVLTGEPYLWVNRKYGKTFEIRNHTKMYFSCNTIPKTSENTYAFFRRFILINCTNKIEEENIDRDILDKICTKKELSGLLNLALKGLKRLEKRKQYDPKYEEYTEEIWDTFSNPLLIFIENYLDYNVSPGVNEEYEIKKDYFLEVYNQFLSSKELPIEKGLNFLTRKINSLKDYKINSRIFHKKGIRHITYTNIKFNEKCIKEFRLDKIELPKEEDYKPEKLRITDYSKDKEDLPYSKVIYDRIIQMFDYIEYKPLYIENIVQVLSVDFIEDSIQDNLKKMIEKKVFDRNSKGELIFIGDPHSND